MPGLNWRFVDPSALTTCSVGHCVHPGERFCFVGGPWAGGTNAADGGAIVDKVAFMFVC
eukprot:COSAG06_NODE_5382_length_3512_cov_6.128040_2_plen_59_part_00